MREIYDRFPDPATLLSMEPEELAGPTLEALAQRIQPFHPGNECSEPLTAHGGLPLYVGREKQAQAAVLEAFAWLQSQCLIVQRANFDGWYALSRRGRRIVEAGAFAEFRAAAHFPKALLHPLIREQVWQTFIRGNYTTAVFEAMRAVEIAVREAARAPAKSVGTALVRDAFNKDNGPLTDKDAEISEREALANLFAGAIGSYKNPHSHRNVPLDDPTEAIEAIMLASHLLRIVDARKPA